MKFLGIEIKREPRPNLSRDVIPAIQGVINELATAIQDLDKRLVETDKKVEATRRKVYRDLADQVNQELNQDQELTAPGPGPGNGQAKTWRTGEPWTG